MMSSNLIWFFPLLFYNFLRRPILDLKIPLMDKLRNKSKFFQNFNRVRRLAEVSGAVPHCLLKQRCENARTVKRRKSTVPGKTREKHKRYQIFQKQSKPKLPRQISINQKPGKTFPQIKIEREPKTTSYFPSGVANLLCGLIRLAEKTDLPSTKSI